MIGGGVKEQVCHIERCAGKVQRGGVWVVGVNDATAAHRVGEEGEAIGPIHRPRTVASQVGLNGGGIAIADDVGGNHGCRRAHEIGQCHRRAVGINKAGAKIARLGVIGVRVVVAVSRDKWRGETIHAIGDECASGYLVSASRGIIPVHRNDVGAPGVGHLERVGRQRGVGSYLNQVGNAHANPFVSQTVVGRRRRRGDNHIAIGTDNFADIVHITGGGKGDAI